MAKKKQEQAKYKFTVGGNLADGRRFEAGEDVPEGLSDKEMAALEELGAIEKVGE